MISNSPYRSAAVWTAPVTLMLLLALIEVFGDSGRAILQYDRAAILGGQWWRLLTGNFAHLGVYHLLLNEMGLLVLVLLCPEALPARVWIRRVAVLGTGMSLGLLGFVPGLTTYVGMSGIIHGLFVLGLVPQVRKKDLIALGCLLYLVGKIGWELYAGAPVSDEAAIGGRVVVESHLFGTLSAVVYGLVFRSFWGKEARVSAQPSEAQTST
ncbi:rhombosortase [Fontimonas sp. SYSU GA230001]|uniref:rhombosortase n=1 Tax=Fontimonas sp. SYSU GA230001 TaxID=3142450 RepID=UPI0032B35186